MIQLVFSGYCFAFITLFLFIVEPFGDALGMREWLQILFLYSISLFLTYIVASRIENSTTRNSIVLGLLRRTRKKELLEYLNVVSKLDGAALGVTLAVAANLRNIFFKKTGIDLADPVAAMENNPKIFYELYYMVEELEREKKLLEAALLTIWVHTLRAASDPSLRQHGTKLWEELSRGFAHVAESAERIYATQGQKLNIDGATEFPVGLSPNT